MRDWHPEDIKAAIRKRGTTISAIARAKGLTPSALGQALVVPRSEGERLIAAVLGIAPMKIWPSRYHADGRRRSPQPLANYRPEPRFHRPVNLGGAAASQVGAKAP